MLVFDNEGPPSTANTTYYFTPSSTVTSGYDTWTAISNASNANFITAPASCTMKALNLAVTNYNASSADTTNVAVYLNGSNTGMHASVMTSGNSATASDTTHTFAVAAGQTLSIGFSETNINPFNKITVELICQ